MTLEVLGLGFNFVTATRRASASLVGRITLICKIVTVFKRRFHWFFVFGSLKSAHPTAMSAGVHHVELAEVDGDNNVSDRKILILYATETGTAQDVADRIARECRRGHFQCRVCNIGSYPPVRDLLTPW